MNPSNAPSLLTPDEIMEHPRLLQSLRTVSDSISITMQPHIDAQRAQHRQYLKDLESGLLTQGITEEQYALDARTQTERIQNAEDEIMRLASDMKQGELLIERIKEQAASAVSETFAYEAEADRLQESIANIQARLGFRSVKPQ
ncbi:hypothetical protein FRB96_000046 [Tulasnella sp. 330]|nr:hypothetical protein FRB96_000046 [Tulasnella sp. 330]KAG8890514.1 hypothetical protein FRB98_007861 [Tulasnella sp. 332]